MGSRGGKISIFISLRPPGPSRSRGRSHSRLSLLDVLSLHEGGSRLDGEVYHPCAASDHMAAAQVRLGHLLEKRSILSTMSVGDKVWLNSQHTPVDIPYKLTSRWFGPFEVVAVHGAQITLDLPETFGKAHRQVNIPRLNFFEVQDACSGESDARPTPLVDVTRYEVNWISNVRTHKAKRQLWVEWKGNN